MTMMRKLGSNLPCDRVWFLEVRKLDMKTQISLFLKVKYT